MTSVLSAEPCIFETCYFVGLIAASGGSRDFKYGGWRWSAVAALIMVFVLLFLRNHR